MNQVLLSSLLYPSAAIIGYLLGSIPFGLVITKLAGLGDIRTIGSGNIGATNVLRTGRKDLALLTLLLDIGKAGIAFLICWQAALALLVPASTGDVYAAVARSDSYSIGLCGGAFAFVGHCFPVWLGFKGGKGVATFVGLLATADWRVGLGFGVIWLAMAAIARMSSFAGLVATLGTPIMAHFLNPNGDLQYVTAALAILIFWRHRANIKRIVDGTEPKIGAKKKEADSQPTSTEKRVHDDTKTSQSSAARVFMSYKREDLATASAIASDLRQDGYSVFFDENIPVGESWDRTIEQEIARAHVVLTLWSNKSRDSSWVRREAREGQRRGILCPALIESCEPSIEFSDIQSANLAGRATGDRVHPEWKRLLAAITKCAEKSRQAASPT